MKNPHYKSAHLISALLSALLFLPLLSVATETDAKKMSVSLFLDKLMANHPEFIKESLNKEISQADIQANESVNGWQLELNAQQAHQEELLASFGPETVDQSLLSASLGKQVWKTGAYLSVEMEKTLSENEYPAAYIFTAPSESEAEQLSLTFSQPLLKNFKGSQSRLAYDLSVQASEISLLQSREAQEQFLFSMMDAYLDWRAAAEEQEINAQRFVLAKEQALEIKKRYDKNFVEKLDWLRAKDSERLAEQQFLLSQARFAAKTQSLAHLSNMPELPFMAPDFELYDFPDLPTLEHLITNSKQSSRNMRLLDLQQTQLKRQSVSLKDETRPELNLNLRAAYKAEDQEGVAPGDPTSDDGQDYSVGLNFKKPLGKSTAKSDYRKIELQLEQLALDKQYAQMEIEANIRNLYIQLQQMKKILALNEELVTAAEQTTKEEQRVYQQGRSDLTRVITSRDQVWNVRHQFASNAINYHKLYLQLNSLTDNLLKESQE